MKTYCDNGYQYWYDTHVKMWTIYQIDAEKNQVGSADYHANRKTLLINYPLLMFTPADTLELCKELVHTGTYMSGDCPRCLTCGKKVML